MNNKRLFSAVLFALMISIFVPGIAKAQDDYRNYAFVVFETTVKQTDVETSDKNPSERRFYVSNVVEFPERDRSIFRNAFKIADEYFIANVVKPLEAKGISHQYYDDAIKINNRASYVETLEDVEALRKQVLEDLKEQNANVFTFNWTRDKDAKGLETSMPTLFHRASEQPLYGANEPKTNASQTIQSPPKPTAKKKPRKNQRQDHKSINTNYLYKELN